MIAVLIHGYPGPINKDHPLYKYFDDRGYSIISQYLFSTDFKFTQEEIKKQIEKELGGREPDVIVGVSFGGLVAPYLAKAFPEAKLVLIAAGPYMRTKISLLNKLLTFEETSALLSPFQWVIDHAPTWLYSIVYNRFAKTPHFSAGDEGKARFQASTEANSKAVESLRKKTPGFQPREAYKMFIHPVINPEEKKLLEEHIRQNWGYLKDIPLSENREVLDFIASTDNTVLLRSLKNATLIFAGEGDTLVSFDLSLKVKNLVKRSILVKTNKSLHYEIFDEENYKQLDDFLDKS